MYHTHNVQRSPSGKTAEGRERTNKGYAVVNQ